MSEITEIETPEKVESETPEKTETETRKGSRRHMPNWLAWGALIVWLLGAVLILQNAVASGHELESRATTILWIVFGVWVLAGVVVWIMRRVRR
jgi:predicted nucleic acid-binding Zn ribbon protein